METENAVVGVRYCGGCNPRYDRVAFVERLKALLPEWRFEAARAGETYGAALIVCGCKTKCAAGLSLPPSRTVTVSGSDELLPARDALHRIFTTAAATAAAAAQGLTKEEVLRILPHRPPVLFLDRVTRLVPGEEITAEFFADPALDWFRGHFPEKAVFPGALLLEAMAQAADVMLLSLEGHRGKTPYLQGLGKANFRRPVLPGETLELRAALLADRPEMGAAVCRGQVFVENELRAEAEIVLALR